jgi:ribosomal protein S18 acetylase RimI-like enzyme
MTHDEELALDETRAIVAAQGAAALTVDNLTLDELHLIAWSGNPLHIDAVRRELLRVPSGDVEYLAVRAPQGRPVAKGMIDYVPFEGAGLLGQLATHPQLQSLGIGAHLMSAAGVRIAARGLPVAMVGVEEGHDRAKSLYERMGFRAVEHGTDSWEVQQDDGTISTHHAQVIYMSKQLV